MIFASRLNSFATKETDKNVLKMIDKVSEVEGINGVEFNYPQHLEGVSAEEIKQNLCKHNLTATGVSLRFGDSFKSGEFTSLNDEITEKAYELVENAIKKCRELGAKTVTICPTYDGFEYSFRLNYSKARNKQIEIIRKLALNNPDINISLEYKPYNPKGYNIIGDIGTAIIALNDINCRNTGLTLDFCHAVMKRDNPSHSLDFAFEKSNVLGIHMNDTIDGFPGGMMVGSYHFMQTIEFIYYLMKHNYDRTIFFDTVPTLERSDEECKRNMKIFKKIQNLINDIGIEYINDKIKSGDKFIAQDILLKLLNNY